MRLPIRAVLFDIGGVFFPWPQADFFARWAERLGIASGSFHQLLWYGPDIEAANVGAITAEEYYRRCARRMCVDQAQVRRLIEDAFAGEQLNEELAAYARRTLRSRVRVAALTNNWSFGRTLIEQRGIAELFDLIVNSAEEGVKKPHARIYHITLERLAIAPAEAVFIDDSKENVEAARALGIRSIPFVSAGQVISELEALLARCGVVRN
ncbi:MAG: HAD family phosphatase [Chloroflexi bacterium]|nr:HAD family phosphatase [Chloroflexota bacterium]